jgi:hypothetical protein
MKSPQLIELHHSLALPPPIHLHQPLRSVDQPYFPSRQGKPRKGGNPIEKLDRNLSSESRGFNSLPVKLSQQPEASLACEYGNVLLEA